MNDTVIEVNNFHKRYGSKTAVEDISFHVSRGEIFGLLGPNGAGKTSTLESLEGLRQPDGGSLNIMGVDPARQPARLRNLIGVQLQSSGLPASMTAREAMRFFCAYHGVSARLDLLDRMGLAANKDTQFGAMSTGQQRRLALALAVSHNPPVIFLDEPTAGLDVPSRIELHEMMRELQASGSTIILATHDMAEAEKLANRVAILLSGKIAATGTPTELTAAGRGLTRISVASEGGCLTAAGISIPDVAKRLVKDNYTVFYSTAPGRSVSAIIDYLDAQHDALIDLRVERPNLEERFLEITQDTNNLVAAS